MTAGSSLIALEAAKAAVVQGPQLFQRYHQRLFSAQFHEALDIGNVSQLAALAEQEGLDSNLITASLNDRRYQPIVLNEYQEAMRLGIQAIPTVLFVQPAIDGPAKAVPVVGAVETDLYDRRLRILRSLPTKPRLADASLASSLACMNLDLLSLGPNDPQEPRVTIRPDPEDRPAGARHCRADRTGKGRLSLC